MVEKRIADLEGLVRSAVIIDEEKVAGSELVGLGTTVIVDFDGVEEQFTIVGAIEAKPAAGLISNESPIGKALLGTRVGQDSYVMTPGGRRRITIKQIVH